MIPLPRAAILRSASSRSPARSLLIAAGLAVAAAVGAAPAHAAEPVTIQGFAIDATEVTIADFRAFAAATGLRTAAERDGGGFEYAAGWERRPGWSVYRPYGHAPETDAEPAVHVSWEEARDYCRWRGGRLPDREEWRLAAFTETRQSPTNGFETGRTYRYPVGDEPEGMNARGADPWPRHAPAAATRRGVNGLFDMGANVWEWLADRRGADALTAGGSWWYGPAQTTADAPQWKPAGFYAVYVGFRCAYDR